ncbi:MAG: hypothetical protein ChlgKO_04230 [Chlamydiales bacterium]
MQPMKLLIFGIPGSGKTVFANQLSNTLKIPVFHIDRHFFIKGWITRPTEDFLKDVRVRLKESSWIIEGNGMRTIEMRYQEADLVIYCCLPRLQCLLRVFWRMMTTVGKEKLDGPEGASNSVSWKLVCYLWNFKKRYKNQIEELQKKYPEVVFRSLRSKKEMINFSLWFF